ncbi:hypothetical protein [Methylomonas sp. MgM2]
MKKIGTYVTCSLHALLMVGCADTSERYRDTHILELPPELHIEHTQSQASVSADDLEPKPASPLAGLVDFQDDGKFPKLTLKTRLDRAWEMLIVALKIGNIKVLDKNREENRIQVRYDPDTAGKKETLFDIFSEDNYAEADYYITLKDGILGVDVNAALSKPDQLEFGEDGSAELVRFLHKIIDEKIINRDRNDDEN